MWLCVLVCSLFLDVPDEHVCLRGNVLPRKVEKDRAFAVSARWHCWKACLERAFQRCTAPLQRASCASPQYPLLTVWAIQLRSVPAALLLGGSTLASRIPDNGTVRRARRLVPTLPCNVS